jgi:hypothetical protein
MLMLTSRAEGRASPLFATRGRHTPSLQQVATILILANSTPQQAVLDIKDGFLVTEVEK